MEYSPPPLFKQGASARAKVVFFAMIAIALLVIDSRMHALAVIRQGVGVMLYPLQIAALAPRDAAYVVGEYFSSLSSLQKENAQLKRERVANAQALQEGQYLLAENAQLRALLGAAERLPVKSIMSEILYDTRDAFTRKIVLDRGAHHGIIPGQPVIDDIGVVGQVTRVFPLTSEVTLLTDKDSAIPVQVVRSGVRSIAYGRGQSGVLDLRFMPTNVDIQKDDMLVTTGVDGVYPPGLAVGTVTQVERRPSDTFAGIICQPSAGIGRNKHLLILMPEAKLAPRPEAESAVGNKDKPVKNPVLEGVDDAAKRAPAPGEQTKVQVAPVQGNPASALPAKPAVQNAAPIAAATRPVAPVQQAASRPVVPVKAAPAPQNIPAQATPAQAAPESAPKRPAPGQNAPAP